MLDKFYINKEERIVRYPFRNPSNVTIGTKLTILTTLVNIVEALHEMGFETYVWKKHTYERAVHDCLSSFSSYTEWCSNIDVIRAYIEVLIKSNKDWRVEGY